MAKFHFDLEGVLKQRKNVEQVAQRDVAVLQLRLVELQTQLQNSVLISDIPGPTGGIQLKTTTGAMISITDVGIIISNGKGADITMVGPSVTINQGALAVI